MVLSITWWSNWRPSTTTSVGLSSFFRRFSVTWQSNVHWLPLVWGFPIFVVDFRLCDDQTDVQRPPTTASVGLSGFFRRFSITWRSNRRPMSTDYRQCGARSGSPQLVYFMYISLMVRWWSEPMTPFMPQYKQYNNPYTINSDATGMQLAALVSGIVSKL